MTFPVGWYRKCALTINSAQIVGSGTHNNFPVLLTEANLPSDMLDKDGAAPARMGGGDIRFTSDASGTTKLPCHVVEFIPADNPANARATIYVVVNLPTGSDTTIYVWYQTATDIDQPKYNDNPDADGFKGSDYVWANYDIVLPLGGFGGLRNLKQANAAKNAGRNGNFSSRAYPVASRPTGRKYITFPSLVKVGDRLYCAAREAVTHYVEGSGQVGIRYSDDMGRSWNEATSLFVTDASFDLRDPRLFLQNDGTLWLLYSKTNGSDTTRVVNYRKSSPPYSSWGAETALTTQTKANNGSRPIQLASGRIMVPCYDIDGTGATAPFVRWSDDGGTTWTTDYLTADGAAPGAYGLYNETTIAEDPANPGNIVAILRRNTYLTLFRQASTDSGQTWSAAAATGLAIDAASAPDMPEAMYCRDGDLLVAYARHRDAPVFRVARSVDHGLNWDAQYASIYSNDFNTTVKPGGFVGNGGYCSMVELTKGLFAIVYYYDSWTPQIGAVWCTHFTKVEDGALNYWTDTSWATEAKNGDGIESSDTDQATGSGSLSYWNNVHNGGAFTISGWAKFNQITDEAHCFVGSSLSPSARGFAFFYDNRTSAGAPNRLTLYKADGASTAISSNSAAISADTGAHRFGVFCSALGTPTFIFDAATYSGSAAITATAGDATYGVRIAGCSAFPAGSPLVYDVPSFRLDGWMGMWSFSVQNLGADYEKTRYNAENSPAAFLTAGTPTSTDATPPTLSGTIAVSSVTTTSYTIECPEASDDIAVAGYQYRLNAGAWVTIAGAARAANITGRTPGSTDAVEMRAFDSGLNYSSTLTASATLGGAVYLVTEAFRDYSGALLAGATIPNVVVHRVSDRSLVLSLSNQVTHATTGVLTITDPALVSGVAYMVTAFNADGTVRGAQRVVAA